MPPLRRTSRPARGPSPARKITAKISTGSWFTRIGVALPPSLFRLPPPLRRRSRNVWRRALVALAVLPNWLAAQTLINQPSGIMASLRGVSSASDRVGWASGSGGTYLATTDGGATWHAGTVPGAEALDFRDVHAVDARTVYVLASGP